MTPQEQIAELEAQGVTVHMVARWTVDQEALENLMAQGCRQCQKEPQVGDRWMTWGEPTGNGYVALASLCSEECARLEVDAYMTREHRGQDYALAFADTPVPDNTITIEADDDEDPFSVMERAADQFFGPGWNKE